MPAALDETVLRAAFADARTAAQTTPQAAFSDARAALRLVVDNAEQGLNVRRLRTAMSALAPWRRVALELVARGLPAALAADIRDAIKLHDFADITKGGRPGRAAVRAMVDAVEQVAIALNTATPNLSTTEPLFDALTLSVVSSQPARRGNTPP